MTLIDKHKAFDEHFVLYCNTKGIVHHKFYNCETYKI